MNKVYFNVNNFPKLCNEINKQGYVNWITFLYDLGYKSLEWHHYNRKSERASLDENEYVMLLLRWS